MCRLTGEAVQEDSYEMERVKGSSGWIVDWHCHRVLGVLASCRSLGNYDLKPYMISNPELMVTDRTEEEEFLILASDRLWDVKVVQNCLTGQIAKKYPEAVSGHSADTAAALLTRMALSKGSMDNVSVVVIKLS